MPTGWYKEYHQAGGGVPVQMYPCPIENAVFKVFFNENRMILLAPFRLK